MRKLSLGDWAALGEFVGAVAIVNSLLIVVFSVNQTTAAMHGSTENVIFERHTNLAKLNRLGTGALAFNRYQPGLLAQDRWIAWNTDFADVFGSDGKTLPSARRRAPGTGYDRSFGRHVHLSRYDNTESAA